MRGPGYKTSFDVRRVWRCAACNYERRCDGRVTTVRCHCAGQPLMQLVGEPRFARLQNRPVDPYIDAELVLAGTESSSGAPAALASESAVPGSTATAIAVLEPPTTAVDVSGQPPPGPAAQDRPREQRSSGRRHRGPRSRRDQTPATGRDRQPPGDAQPPVPSAG